MLRIYYARCDELSLDNEYCISEYRKERLRSVMDEAGKRAGLGAELLLNHAIKELFPEASFPLEIERAGNGRPTLKNLPLYFSLSHSGGYCACAVSPRPLGLDIQSVEAPRENVLRRVFSEAERDYVLSNERPDQAFTSLWTMKESVVKLSGEGIGAMLSGIDVLSMHEIWHGVSDGLHFALYCGEGRQPAPELIKLIL